MILLTLSFLLLLLSFFFLPKNKFFLVFFLVFSFFYFLVSTFFIIGNYYTGAGIDESVIYHIFSEVKGAGVGADLKLIFLIIFCILFSLFFLFFFYFYGKKIEKFSKKYFKILFFLFLILSFLIHPALKNFYDLGYFSFSEEKFTISYEIPEIKKKEEKTKNLIYIYLESFEKLYLDEKIFPGLAKNLKNLEEKSIFFENVEQAFGTNWTIAGMVGSQCGTPLINSGGGGNSMHGIEEFLPGAFCIGDFLKKSGYELSYVGGADLTFAGKGNFYKTHGFSNVLGKNELENELEDKKYQNDWGFYDDTNFDFVYKEYEQLSEKGGNFGLFMITMDTHLNDGFVSKSCPKTDYEISVLNSLSCSDFLLGKFLEKIQNHKNFKDTIIVISSDHYAMPLTETTEILDKYKKDRKNLFLILNGEQQKIEKKSSTLDIAPTVLSKMGFEIEKFGFGINIFSDLESKENSILRKNKKLFEKFWTYPSLKNGIDFDLENKKIFINGKNIGFPALLVLDKKNDIEKIIWEDLVNGKLSDKKDKNTIYLSFYTNGKFCLDFGKKSQKCFSESGKINYEKILENFK